MFYFLDFLYDLQRIFGSNIKKNVWYLKKIVNFVLGIPDLGLANFCNALYFVLLFIELVQNLR